MKIYISTDMEGATGICSPDQCTKGHPAYSEGRLLLVADVNAAIEGALAGGATEIIVADMHDGSFNLPLEEVHPAAKVLYGVPHAGPRFPFLDESVDGLFLVAYHARSGTTWGVLEHTMSSQDWLRVTANGIEIGEVGIDAALAGEAGVPVLLVTGDDKVCEEACLLLGSIETAVVKQGVGRLRALCQSPTYTQEMIRSAAQRALALKGKVQPLSFGSPVEVAVAYKHTSLADGTPLDDPQQKRLDGYTVVNRYPRFADWYGGVWK